MCNSQWDKNNLAQNDYKSNQVQITKYSVFFMIPFVFARTLLCKVQLM